MIQKVLKVGSSAAVTIPKKALAELGLKVGDTISFSLDTSGSRFTYAKVRKGRRDPRQDKISSLTLDFIERYRADLEALADK